MRSCFEPADRETHCWSSQNYISIHFLLMIQAFQVCHGNVIRYCVCRALQLDPQVLPLVLVPLSNFAYCRNLRPVQFICLLCYCFVELASVVPLFCHTLSIIALHGKLVQKNPLKAWLRMAVHNGSITVLVIKPSGRVMKIYLHFIDYTFPHILPQPPR